MARATQIVVDVISQESVQEKAGGESNDEKDKKKDDPEDQVVV